MVEEKAGRSGLPEVYRVPISPCHRSEVLPSTHAYAQAALE